jgi:hypothetical protein
MCLVRRSAMFLESSPAQLLEELEGAMGGWGASVEGEIQEVSGWIHR